MEGLFEHLRPRRKGRESVFCVRMAGIPIGIEHRYSYIRRLCAGYITQDTPLFTVCVSDQDLIREEYGLEAVVFDLGNSFGETEMRLLAGKAADYLAIEIKDGYRVGLMSSRTVKFIADSIPVTKKHGFEYVPLCGGFSSNGTDWYANVIAQEMAAKSNGRYYVFTAPNFANSVEAKNAFVAEPSVRKVLDLIPTCDVSLVGIGNVDASSTGALAGGLTDEDLNSLRALHAVSSICSSYLDARFSRPV